MDESTPKSLNFMFLLLYSPPPGSPSRSLRHPSAGGGLPKTRRFSFPRALKLLCGGASARGQRSKEGEFLKMSNLQKVPFRKYPFRF